MARIKLGTLYCRTTEDNIGGDHPYIKINGVKVWGPVRMLEGHSNEVNVTREFNGTAVVELWEEDDIDPDDLLGRHSLYSGSGVVEYIGDGAHYNLYYEIS